MEPNELVKFCTELAYLKAMIEVSITEIMYYVHQDLETAEQLRKRAILDINKFLMKERKREEEQ